VYGSGQEYFYGRRAAFLSAFDLPKKDSMYQDKLPNRFDVKRMLEREIVFAITT
jgi:hypothetical protein